ncbi:MAG: CocE/NonD family hydrolase [Gemmatimonadetes bacterium]|nr:CocE/NonD family hydrolase [Gemmatimonadota bacterium]MBT7861058.1 CocE/NonD family hydrolase [Gemmatimonadota bacterium]
MALLLPVMVDADEEADELAEYIRANYTKYEHQIPMRDGVRLFTAVYVPKADTTDYGMMLIRTPYSVSPYGVDNYPRRLGPSEIFAREGFIFVEQDVRGRYLSEGAFIEMTPHQADKSSSAVVDESSDTYDTIDWLVKHVPDNNGKVGMYGVSYPGFYVAAGMIDAHPALVAASPQAPIADLFQGDDSYHNGAFMLAANFGFFTFFEKHEEPQRPRDRVDFDFKTTDGYQFYLDMGPLVRADELYFHGGNPYFTESLDHATYDDHWQARSIDHFIDDVPPAVMTVGGWFDAEDLAGPFKVFRAVERNGNKANHLVMGPWSHGGWHWGDGNELGDVRFHVKTSEYFRDEVEFPFFNHHLHGEGDSELPKALVFQTGTNQWRRYDQWPPKSVRQRALYFGAAGSLSYEPLGATSEASPERTSSITGMAQAGQASGSLPLDPGIDTWVSDPARPVPFTEQITTWVPRSYMVADQRFASKRTDVMVYQTEPLEEDLAIAGPITPKLWVTTTGTDADFVVKLIDVYPNDYPDIEPNPARVRMGGYQQLVRGEPIRAKFRNDLTTPEPMVPGELTLLEFEMPDVCHVFRRGHRVMVQVQSSWFPLVDRNPQTFVDIPRAAAADFVAATHTIHRTAQAPSAILLPVLP